MNSHITYLIDANINYYCLSVICDIFDNIMEYRVAAFDVIYLEAVELLGGKTMERLYGNGRKFTSFSLTRPALVIEHLHY